MSQFFASVDQSIGVSASASILPMDIQGCPSNGYSGLISLGWTGLISLLSKGLSSLFSSLRLCKSGMHSVETSRNFEHGSFPELVICFPELALS